jgi:hypothetical protein
MENKSNTIFVQWLIKYCDDSGVFSMKLYQKEKETQRRNYDFEEELESPEKEIA